MKKKDIKVKRKVKKKKKKGFTLVEIIAAVIILGVLSIFAVVTYNRNLRGFRNDYYEEIKRTLTETGKEFFNDNRKYRPKDVLQGQVVPISTLITQRYIEEVKDYKGNRCSNNSYVIIIKNGKDDYIYHTCLMCPEDDYSNMKDKYCDSAWTNSTTIEYDLATPPELYVYKGTPKSSLREQLAVKVSFIKRNANGEVIGVVDGTGFDEVPTVYPENIDTVNTDVLGTYPLDYKYKDKITRGSVTVYNFKAPLVGIKKENIVATSLSGSTITERGDYTSGEWTQKILLTLNKGESTTDRINNVVNKYQWNKDGVWQDLCSPSNCNEIPISSEMNQNIKFRSIDIEGRISEETDETTIRIDNTKPTCNIETSGEIKINRDWYTNEVTIAFSKKEDLVRTNPESVSGIKVFNITVSTGELSRTRIDPYVTHGEDTAGITYIGYVEDNAGNFITCNVNFKKDGTSPTCKLRKTGTVGNDDWYISDVLISFLETKDNLSGVKNYGLGGYENSKTANHTEDTGGVEYVGHIIDEAGNTNTCTTNFKRDVTLPTCSLTTSGTYGEDNWYISPSVEVSFSSTEDNLSGVSKYGIGNINSPSNVSHTANTTGYSYTGYIEDGAGNLGSCTVSFKKDDGSEMGGCSTTENWVWTTHGTFTIVTTLANKPVSGCMIIATSHASSQSEDCVSRFPITKRDGQAIDFAENFPRNFISKSGVLYSCGEMNVSVKIDRIAPTCGNVTYGSNSASGVSVSIACSDDHSKCKNSSVSTSNATSPGSLTIEDNAGNTNSCSYSVSSYKIHRERTWNTCKTGSHDECTKEGWCDKTVDFDGSSADCYSKQGTINQFDKTCVVTYWCCKKREDTCQGGWNDWSGYSNGRCPKSNSNTYQCEEVTMYKGG